MLFLYNASTLGLHLFAASSSDVSSRSDSGGETSYTFFFFLWLCLTFSCLVRRLRKNVQYEARPGWRGTPRLISQCGPREHTRQHRDPKTSTCPQACAAPDDKTRKSAPDFIEPARVTTYSVSRPCAKRREKGRRQEWHKQRRSDMHQADTGEEYVQKHARDEKTKTKSAAGKASTGQVRHSKARRIASMAVGALSLWLLCQEWG